MAVAVLSLPSAPLHQQLIPWRSGFTPCALLLPLLSSPRTPATAPSPSAVPGWYHYTPEVRSHTTVFISHLLLEISGRIVITFYLLIRFQTTMDKFCDKLDALILEIRKEHS
ncbi:hypothetical protein [Anaerovibrio sp. RM50]|uniref:hypothetical protein n=1 Tax=Anaerovibrio sp. RM50 TaxID=1200557 RepID=UPI0012EB29EE|nr:hypothetical protein [Anaerovibrio sp. RM50]